MEQNQSINLSLPLPQGTQSTGEPGGGGGGELVLRGSIVEKKQGGWGHFISFLWDLESVEESYLIRVREFWEF